MFKQIKKKKIALFILSLTLCMTLSGCGEADMVKYIDNWEGEIKVRIEQNQAEVEKIYKAGLLSQEQAKSLKDALETQRDRINSTATADVLASTVNSAGEAAAAGRKGDNAVGLELISTDNEAIKQLMNNLDFEVYVLKKDPLNTGKGENALATLDLISKEVEKAKEGKASNIDSYFINSGRKVWDTTKPENQLIKPTDASGRWDSTIGCEGLKDNVNVVGQHFIGVKTADHDLGDYSHKDTKSVIEIRLTEFNPDAVSRLVGADGVNKDVYVIVGKKCYLMQYPVQYVSGFKKEGNTFTAQYEESDMQINILTKSIMDKDGKVCSTTAGDILKVSGTGGYSELGEASFVIDGVKGPVTKFGYDTRVAQEGQELPEPPNADKFGRVVLRDYLELNYMPTVVDGENLVALGRRIRLTSFKGTGQAIVGLFIDKSGNEIQNSLRIKITDLMDISSGTDGKRTKLELQAVEGQGESGEAGAGGGVSSIAQTAIDIAAMTTFLTSSSDSALGGLAQGHIPSKAEAIEQLSIVNSYLTGAASMYQVDKNTATEAIRKIQVYVSSQIGVTNLASVNDTVTRLAQSIANKDTSQPADEEQEEPSDDANPTDDVTNVFEVGQSQNNLLETVYAEEIKVSTRFPGPLVATSDDLKLGVVQGEAVEENEQTEENSTPSTPESNSDTEKIKHFMYGMAVDIDPFQSNMFSGWIEITGDNGDIGSLDWWNNWLHESTYKYQIDRDKVINFLTGNYMYEMRDNTNILLDIPTITQIQKQYDKEDKIAGANFITTMFTVLGFIVIAYSTLILAAWVYDTNIVAGPRLMGLFSFGRWEAISDTDEMPYMDTTQKHYMTFGKTLKACIVLIGVGVLIVFVDIMHIVDLLILLFGKIAEIFGNVLQGIGM